MKSEYIKNTELSQDNAGKGGKASVQPNIKALYIIDKGPHGSDQLCLHLTLTHKNGYLCFHDTDRGHMLKGEIVEEFENGFKFIDRNDREWQFREVTIQEFRHKIQRNVYNGEHIANLCTTTADLWEYYRKAFPV